MTAVHHEKIECTNCGQQADIIREWEDGLIDVKCHHCGYQCQYDRHDSKDYCDDRD